MLYSIDDKKLHSHLIWPVMESAYGIDDVRAFLDFTYLGYFYEVMVDFDHLVMYLDAF